MTFEFTNKILVPIIDENSDLRMLQYRVNTRQKFSTPKFSTPLIQSRNIFIHKNVQTQYHPLRGLSIKTNSAEILQPKVFTSVWDNKENLEQLIIAADLTIGMQEMVLEEISEPITPFFYQASGVDSFCYGFRYEIEHIDDYNPKCAVCAEHTKIIHTILGEWMKNVILVEENFNSIGYFVVKDTKKMIILKKSSQPMVERLLEWFVENFKEIILLANIKRITFTEFGSEFQFTKEILL